MVAYVNADGSKLLFQDLCSCLNFISVRYADRLPKHFQFSIDPLNDKFSIPHYFNGFVVPESIVAVGILGKSKYVNFGFIADSYHLL